LSLRVEDYGLIGDCETAALVGRNGSIDWLCLPRFNSESCFAALLGDPKNGRWMIASDQSAEITRQYRASTLILETTFSTAEGRVLLIDFMPPKGNASDVMRIGIEGQVRISVNW
jgi:GH15 family glucan-1,4-alpha-glucosidase